MNKLTYENCPTGYDLGVDDEGVARGHAVCDHCAEAGATTRATWSAEIPDADSTVYLCDDCHARLPDARVK